MAVAYTFTPEQIERMKGQETAAKLAAEFGCSDMPIRRFRQKMGWVKEFVLPVPPAPGIVGEAPSEVDMLRDEVRRLRAQTRRTDRASIGDERVLRAIETAVASVEPIELAPLPDIGPARNDDAHHRMVAIWSDWHYGEVVSKAQMGGINEFNVAICEERVAQLVRSILAFKRVRPAMTGIDVWCLGDMASGAIHALAETNELPTAEQYVRAGYLIARAIEQLAPHFESVDCAGIVGNHPRPGKEPASKDAYNNGDWIAYQMAMALTRHLPNVSWEIPQGGMLVRRFAGKTFLLWHGDGVRSSMPGVPFGGVMRRWNVLKSTYADRGIKLDYVVVGHFHQLCVVPGIFMNGSLIGANEYGIKNFGGGESPKQLLLTADEKRSRITDINVVSFEDV